MKLSPYQKISLLQIILNVYKYLPLQDILNASVTCRQWYSTSLHSFLIKKRHLVVKGDLMGDSKTEYLEFLDSIIRYRKLEIFDSPSCTNNMDFWNKLANSLEYLEMDYNDDFLKFVQVLKHLSNLKSFHLYFRDVTFKETETNVPELEFTKLKTFVFHMDKYSSTITLKCLLSMMPELDRIHLKLERTLKRKSREYLYNYLNEGKNRIKHLIMYADRDTWVRIWTLRGMKFQTLSINIVVDPMSIYLDSPEDIIQNYIGETFTDNHDLLHLKVPCDYVRRIDVEFFATTFPNLQTFNFQGNGTENITELKKLTKLKVCKLYLLQILKCI